MAAITTQEFEHHFKSLYKPLCLFALRYTDQVDDAEDIVQQASLLFIGRLRSMGFSLIFCIYVYPKAS